MRCILILCIIPGILIAADFFDDFESYPLGDLADTAYWLRIDPSGNLVVTEDGGNKVVETVWNGYDHIAYVSLGSAVWTDGKISADIKFSGSELIFGFMARANTSTGECYIGGIYPIYPPIGVTIIGYIDENGEYTILSSDYINPLNTDTWYNVSFEVTGNNPVSLKLSVNGTVNTECQDDTYDLGAGMSGIGGTYEDMMPVIYIDNFDVNDYSMAIATTTFGAIKALFR